MNEFIGQILKKIQPLDSQVKKIANDPTTQKLSHIGSQIPKMLKDPAIQRFLHNFAYWASNQEKAAPHMSRILGEMETNPNFSEALKTIPYRQLFRLIVDNEIGDNVKLIDLINTDIFQGSVLGYFDKIKIGIHFSNRKILIKEAFELYQKEFYAGCLCLLHSQFEGILTDYLLFKGLIKEDTESSKTTFYDVAKLPTVVRKSKAMVTGLSAKITLAKNISDSFKRLDTYIYDNDQNIKFHNERNDILHGSNISNFNAERCFVVFIWIDSILGSIYTEEVALKNLPTSLS